MPGYRPLRSALAVALIIITVNAVFGVLRPAGGVPAASAQAQSCGGSPSACVPPSQGCTASTGACSPQTGRQACSSTQTATAASCLGYSIQVCPSGSQLLIVQSGQACPGAGQSAGSTCLPSTTTAPPATATTAGSGGLSLPTGSGLPTGFPGGGQLPPLPGAGQAGLPSGGQFSPPAGGQFSPPPGGQFSPPSGGQSGTTAAANQAATCTAAGTTIPPTTVSAAPTSPQPTPAPSPSPSPSPTPAPTPAPIPASPPTPAISGLTENDVAFVTPAGVTQAPTAPFAGTATFAAATTASFDAGQRALVTADVRVSGGSQSTSTVQAASIDVPAGTACNGSGPGSLTLSVTDQKQPLGVQIGGSCGSGSSTPLSFSQPVTVCVTLAQYVIDYAHGNGSNGLALIGSDRAPLPQADSIGGGSAGAQVCGSVPAPGTYTVGTTGTPATSAPSSN